jgi:clan AA aspartic protease (TIGR02281 family)
MAATMIRRTLATAAIGVAISVAPSHTRADAVILQAQRSMFYTHVALNDRVVTRALIDTGATYLSVCAPIAKDLGVELGGNLTLITSNGEIKARRATIESVRIGPIEVRGVEAVVKSETTPCEETIVGMSVLHKLDSVILKEGTLTLIGPPPQPGTPRGPSVLPARGEQEIGSR